MPERDEQDVIAGQIDLRRAYQDDQVAQEYVARRFTAPLGALLHRRQVQSVVDLIATEGLLRAVEIAPGPARLSVDIVPKLQSAVLVDASAQMLHEAAKRLVRFGVSVPVQLVQADAFNLPIRAGSDLVYSFRLIRHFERKDRMRLYRQIFELLRPGGWLVFDAVNAIVSAPLRAKAKPGEYAHYDALLRPDEIREELHEAGYSRIDLRGVQHRFPTLQRCQTYVAPRSSAIATTVMELIDRSGGEPLEWIVRCRRE